MLLACFPKMSQYALSWGGGTHFDDPNFIGRFGFGLPNASINQTRRVEVYTKTADAEVITRAYLDADTFPAHGIQEIPAPEEGVELPEFVQQYLKRANWPFEHGTVVYWVRPDRLTYKTAANLKEHLLDDFGTTYRYLLNDVELAVEGKEVEAVDPLFLEPKARYYRDPEKGGAQLRLDRSIPVKLIEDETTGALHLEKLEEAEFNKIKKDGGGKSIAALGAIHVRIARLPLGLAVGRKGDAGIEAIDSDATNRFKIRQSRRGMSFVRAKREIETVDLFPRGSELGDWPLLQGYAYHWAIEVRWEPELDEVFGITNDKQRVRPIEEFWKLLSSEGIEIDRLLNKENNWQSKERKKASDAAKEPKASPEPSPAEIAARNADNVTGTPITPPPHERKHTGEKFHRAAQKRAEVTGKSVEEAEKALKQEAQQRPYLIEYFDDQYGPFYKPAYNEENALQVVVYINRLHPFYEGLYTANMSSQAREGLNLFLICLARAELKAENEVTKEWYEYQRPEIWSKALAVSMKNLTGQFAAMAPEMEETAAA